MDVILKKYLSLIKLLIIFDIFGIFIVGKLDAFWFIRSEKDKAICLERASKEVNEALLENEIKSLQKNISETSQDLGVLNLKLSKWESDVKNSEELLE